VGAVGIVLLVVGGFLVYEVLKGGGITAASAATPSGTGSTGVSAVAPGIASDWTNILSQAGFSGQGLQNALAVISHESSGNPNAQSYNPQTVVNGVNLGPSVDRGLFQFNNLVPPIPVSDQCAYDPLCAAQAAFQATAGGCNWGAWATGLGLHC